MASFDSETIADEAVFGGSCAAATPTRIADPRSSSPNRQPKPECPELFTSRLDAASTSKVVLNLALPEDGRSYLQQTKGPAEHPTSVFLCSS